MGDEAISTASGSEPIWSIFKLCACGVLDIPCQCALFSLAAAHAAVSYNVIRNVIAQCPRQIFALSAFHSYVNFSLQSAQTIVVSYIYTNGTDDTCTDYIESG